MTVNLANALLTQLTLGEDYEGAYWKIVQSFKIWKRIFHPGNTFPSPNRGGQDL